MPDQPPLLTLPCDFPIKIIGENKDLLLTDVTNIVQKHFPATKKSAITTRLSKGGKYLSITVTLYLEKQVVLDALHADLKAYPGIKMVL